MDLKYFESFSNAETASVCVTCSVTITLYCLEVERLRALRVSKALKFHSAYCIKDVFCLNAQNE